MAAASLLPVDPLDLAAWRAASAAYPSELARRAAEPKVRRIHADLAGAEAWVLGALPAAARARAPPSLSRDDLVRLMTWKRAKCGDSFGNLGRDVERNTDEAVASATAAALAAAAGGGADGVMAAVTALCALSGVGPATASGVLSALDASVPFLTDAAATLLGAPAKFRATEVRALLDRSRAVAEALTGAEAAAGGAAAGARVWTPRDVEQALWAAWRLAKAGRPVVRAQKLAAAPAATPAATVPAAVPAVAADGGASGGRRSGRRDAPAAAPPPPKRRRGGVA